MWGRRIRTVLAAITTMVVAGCGQVAVDLPIDIGEDFDLDSVLDEIRDCERLTDTFIAVVSEGADQLDALADRSGGRVSQPELREKIEAISVNEFFAIAEQLGCRRIQLQLDTIDQLRDLDPEGAAGEELIDAILEQVEAKG